MPTIDFTRPPTAKEKAVLTARLQRLEVTSYADHVNGIYAKMDSARASTGPLASDGLRIRPEFSYSSTGADTDASDRKAPPRGARPPATRISSSRGSALRLMLTAMALTQLHRKQGAKAKLSDFGIEVTGTSQAIGWSDLVAGHAVDSHRARVLLTARDKRARTVRQALTALEEAGLASIPGVAHERNRFENFVLLREGGAAAIGEAEEYTVPTPGEAFVLPTGFVKNGWLHVLEDSEIAVLLMLACRKGGWVEDDFVVIPAEVRLRQYGIHRDPYSSARKTLEWFGLLDVEEEGRHKDGRAENDDRRLNRMRIVSAGFEEPAVPSLLEALKHQLARI